MENRRKEFRRNQDNDRRWQKERREKLRPWKPSLLKDKYLVWEQQQIRCWAFLLEHEPDALDHFYYQGNVTDSLDASQAI